MQVMQGCQGVQCVAYYFLCLLQIANPAHHQELRLWDDEVAKMRGWQQECLHALTCWRKPHRVAGRSQNHHGMALSVHALQENLLSGKLTPDLIL